MFINKGTVNEKKALQGLSLHLNDGDFVTVIGGNGAGKSTMLNAIAGVWPVDSGTITIDDIDVTKQPEYKRAKYIGRVFQDPMMGTASNMQIEENLAIASRRGKFPGLSWSSKASQREKFREITQSIPHIMGNHQRSQMLSCYDLFCKCQYFCCCFWV